VGLRNTGSNWTASAHTYQYTHTHTQDKAPAYPHHTVPRPLAAHPVGVRGGGVRALAGVAGHCGQVRLVAEGVPPKVYLLLALLQAVRVALHLRGGTVRPGPRSPVGLAGSTPRAPAATAGAAGGSCHRQARCGHTVPRTPHGCGCQPLGGTGKHPQGRPGAWGGLGTVGGAPQPSCRGGAGGKSTGGPTLGTPKGVRGSSNSTTGARSPRLWFGTPALVVPVPGAFPVSVPITVAVTIAVPVSVPVPALVPCRRVTPFPRTDFKTGAGGGRDGSVGPGSIQGSIRGRLPATLTRVSTVLQGPGIRATPRGWPSHAGNTGVA
jgi:hypothetical protein